MRIWQSAGAERQPRHHAAGGPDAVVSNLPYSVGTRILLDLAMHPAAPRRFVVLVQSEVAERFRAGPGTEARAQSGVWLQLDYEVSVLRAGL